MADAPDISKVNLYTRVPGELAREFRVRCAKLEVSPPAAIADLIAEWLGKSIPNSGHCALTGGHLPTKDPESALGELPYEVISFFRKHWADQNCRECVLAIARIWDVGDPEIMDSLTRNCKTFRRASDMVERLEEHGTAPGGNPPDYDAGVKQILSRPRQGKPKTRGGKS